MRSELIVDRFEMEEDMDKFYFGKTVARERQHEINRDLAVRHMLKEARGDFFRVSKTRRLVMRFAPVVIVMSILALLII